jgi:hypothetical protein
VKESLGILPSKLSSVGSNENLKVWNLKDGGRERTIKFVSLEINEIKESNESQEKALLKSMSLVLFPWLQIVSGITPESELDDSSKSDHCNGDFFPRLLGNDLDKLFHSSLTSS